MTRIGPGHAGGKLLRSYWQPVALVDELEGERAGAAGAAPRRKPRALQDGEGRLRPDRPRTARTAARTSPTAGSRTAACAARSTAGSSTSTATASRRRPSPRAAGCASTSGSGPTRWSRGAASCSRISARARRPRSRTSTASSRRPRTRSRSRATGTATGCRRSRSASTRRTPRGCTSSSRTRTRRRAYGRQFRAASASSELPMTKVLREYDRPKLRVERAATACRFFALRRISDAHTHIRVTNILFPQAFVIPMNAGDDDHPVARAGRRHRLLLVLDLHQLRPRRSTRRRCARSA